MSLQPIELTENTASFNSYELPNETTSILPVQTSSKQLENSGVVYPGIPDFPPSPVWLFALKTTLCLAVLFVTIIGNSLVVISFIKFKKLQIYTNYYIVTLAVADLASGITPVVLNVTWLIGYWPFGNIVCIVSVYLNTVLAHTTFLLTFIICVDRYRALCMPLKHLREKNRRHAAKMILPGVLIPLLLWSVVILILPSMGVFRPIPPFRCYIPYASNKAVLLGASIVISWIPIVGTSCLYSFIYFRVIRTRLAKTENLAKCGNEPEIPEKSSAQQLINHSAQQPNNGPAHQQLNNDPAQQLNNGTSKQPNNGPAHQQPNTGLAQQPNHCSSPVNLNESCKGAAHHTDEPSQATGKENHEHPNNIEIVMRSIGVSQQKQGPLRSTHRLRSLTSSRRATRTLAYIIVVMVISGTPYSIYSLLITIWPDLPDVHTIRWLVGYIVHLSSATNPLCYASCNPLFKQAFIRLLCCGLRWRKNNKKAVSSSGLY